MEHPAEKEGLSLQEQYDDVMQGQSIVSQTDDISLAQPYEVTFVDSITTNHVIDYKE